MSRVRVTLLAGVSAVAIVAAQPEAAFASDLPTRQVVGTPAQPTFRDRWTWWVEGGATFIEGDPGVAGMTNFNVDPKHLGWEAAFGLEFQQAGSPWIWTAQFRVGAHGKNTQQSTPIAIFQGSGTAPAVTGVNAGTRREHHWAADFMIGRDLGVGQGQVIGRFGVRIAQIWGRTTGSAQWSPVPALAISCAATASYCGSEFRYYEQTTEFLGGGPRFQVDGTVPLGGVMSLNYMAGVAALYGRRKANQNVDILTLQPTGLPGTTISLVSGGPINTSSSSDSFVFNIDALLGLGFALNPNTILAINYHFDGYFRALRGYDSNGNVTNLDRFYHGPSIRLTVTN